jgi:hypothetical protein
MTQPTGCGGLSLLDARFPGQAGPEGVTARAPDRAPSGPGSFLLMLALFIPGVLVVALAVLVALPGVVLLAAALRRLPASSPASEPATERPQGQDDPRPRVWLAAPSREVH